MAKEAYYFSHDSNARNDTKILSMRCDYGLEGYAMYWMIVECMRDEEEYNLKLEDNTYRALAMQMHAKADTVEKFITDCINTYHLFQSDGQAFWSNSLLRRMGKMNDLREKRRQAAAKRWESDANTEQEECNSNANAEQIDAKERKGKEIKSNENKLNEREKKVKYAEFVSLLPEEYQKLVDEHGEPLTQRMIDILDNYKGANGKKYKSDYRAILNWVVDKAKKELPQKGTGPKSWDALRALDEKYRNMEGDNEP